MANEDPDGIPEQIRRNRPFFLALGLAFLIGVAAFLYILWLDTESKDIERNDPATISAPNADPASAPAADPTAAPAGAPATP